MRLMKNKSTEFTEGDSKKHTKKNKSNGLGLLRISRRNLKYSPKTNFQIEKQANFNLVNSMNPQLGDLDKVFN